MKNRLFIAIIAMVIGCAFGVVRLEAAETIKIGCLYDLSGPLAGFGKKSHLGLKLAIKDINADGGVLGKSVEAIVRDTKAYLDESGFPKYVDEFLTKEKVVYVTGGYSDSIAAAVQKLTVYKGVPYMAPSPAGGVADRGKDISPYKITWLLHPDVRAFCQFPYLLTNNLVPKKCIILGPDYGWGWDSNAASKNAITQYGGEVLKEYVTPVPTLDFIAYVTEFERLAPKGATIFSSNAGAEQIALLKAIYDAKLLEKGFAFVANTMDNSVCHYGLEQKYIEGVWIGIEQMYDLPAGDKTWRNFVKHWYDEYKDYPDYGGVWEYFTNYVALKSMNETKSLDPKIWVSYMKGKEWTGIVTDSPAMFSDVNGRLLKTEHLFRGKSQSMMKDRFPEIDGIGAEWDHWEAVHEFPVSYQMRVLTEEDIRSGVKVGDSKIGAGVKDDWK